MIDEILEIFKVHNLPTNTKGNSYKLLSDFCKYNLDKDYKLVSSYFMISRNSLRLTFKDNYLYHNYYFLFDTNVVNNDLLTFIEYVYVGSVPVTLIDNIKKELK